MINFFYLSNAAAFLLVFAFLFVWDIRSEKPDLSKPATRIRYISGVSFLLTAACCLIFWGDVRIGELGLWSVAVASAVLCVSPSSYEKQIPSWWFALATSAGAVGAAAGAALAGLGPAVLRTALALIVCVSSVSYMLYRCRKRYGRVRSLFSSRAVWHNVEDTSRLISHSLLLALCCLLSLSDNVSGVASLLLEIVAGVGLLTLYGLLYYKSFSGHQLIVSASQEQYIKEALRGSLRESSVEHVADDQKMNKLYSRVLQFMDTERPYLSETFSLEELSRKLFTNKVYLSKTINMMSGRNFRQFINYYRVNHSIELMKDNPRIKITELSVMSGFHNVVSFNQSFRLYMSDTPNEYLHKLQLSIAGF